MTTAQTTLAATAARDAAFRAAIDRIASIMLPGAEALAGTRSPSSGYWIEREHDLSSRAPFHGRTLLMWRDAELDGGSRRAPFDNERRRRTYSVQVIVPDDISPAVLTELARVAAILTEEIVREAQLLTAAQVAALDSERQALDAVALETFG